MFILTISSLTVSNFPWFMGLTFQVPVQYCSLQHWILLSLPDTSTTDCRIHFGPATSYILGLLVILLLSSPVPLQTWGTHILVSYLFGLLYSLWGSHGHHTGVVCHCLLQWIKFCQNSLLWPICLGWPYTARLIASLSYTSPFAMTRQWSMKWGGRLDTTKNPPGARDCS